MQRVYVAVIEKAEDGYGVFFPDLPGATSHGATVGEAAVNAALAAQAHVALLAEFDEKVPAPRELQDIPLDPEVAETARVVVPVEVNDARVRVNITLQESVLATLDGMANGAGLDRSAAIASLVRNAVPRHAAAEEDAWRTVADYQRTASGSFDKIAMRAVDDAMNQARIVTANPYIGTKATVMSWLPPDYASGFGRAYNHPVLGADIIGFGVAPTNRAYKVLLKK